MRWLHHYNAVTYSLYLVLSPLYAVFIHFYAVAFSLYAVHVVL